jgi:6,7-dimethyl-8-ribityllumazine synthase
MRFAIVVSRTNQSVSQGLLEGALRAFQNHRVKKNSLKILWVPGAFEIPLIAHKLAKSGKFNAVVCLGCVLQGETLHNRYISEAAAIGIARASLSSGVPITFGVLTPHTMEQARARSRQGSQNKGTEAAEAAIEMAELVKTAGIR